MPFPVRVKHAGAWQCQGPSAKYTAVRPPFVIPAPLASEARERDQSLPRTPIRGRDPDTSPLTLGSGLGDDAS
jgi:hypothetical protein